MGACGSKPQEPKDDHDQAKSDQAPAEKVEQKPAEQKPAEQKPAEQKSAEQKPVEKPAEKPAEKPVEKPVEKKSSEKPQEIVFHEEKKEQVAPATKPLVVIVIYSMWGHIAKLAEAVKEGAVGAGVDVKIVQVKESISEDLKASLHGVQLSYPEATLADLEAADGVLFGLPTRFGMAASQVKIFWDSTGSLWAQGKLVGKPASIFVSTAQIHGGQETTAWSWITQLTHHGMLFVPIGYSTPLLFDNSQVHGGTPYGAGTIANGDGSRQPSQLELDIGKHQGKYFSGVVQALKKGRAQ